MKKKLFLMTLITLLIFCSCGTTTYMTNKVATYYIYDGDRLAYKIVGDYIYDGDRLAYKIIK